MISSVELSQILEFSNQSKKWLFLNSKKSEKNWVKTSKIFQIFYAIDGLV